MQTSHPTCGADSCLSLKELGADIVSIVSVDPRFPAEAALYLSYRTSAPMPVLSLALSVVEGVAEGPPVRGHGSPPCSEFGSTEFISARQPWRPSGAPGVGVLF